MRIGIDLDRTLFRTEDFKDLYNEEIEGLYYVEDPAPVSHGVYDPEKHAEICGVEKDVIWDFFRENDISGFLYDDINLLEELEDHELVLVTRGNEKFQRMKAEASGAAEYFDEVFVVQEESKDEAGIDLLVDDSREEVERADVPGIIIERPGEGLEKVLREVGSVEP